MGGMIKYILVLNLFLLGSVIGCAQQPLVSGAELAKFNAAGPIQPELDASKLKKAANPTGIYKVVPGDVIEIYMPRVMATVANKFSLAEQDKGKHITRVYRSGEIIVPLIGKQHVAGKTPEQIEEQLIDAFSPEFLKTSPTVVVSIKKYRSHPVTIIGAVKAAGTYDLRNNELSLISLLTKAQGISDNGARLIRITRRSDDTPEQEPILLPVKGLDIDFKDVALQSGDLVEVERFDLQSVSVIGLVNSPQTFSYPASDRFNLLQAIAKAGGMNDVADPKYATIYRLNPDGSIAAARFHVIGKDSVPYGAAVRVKPGDVVAVEHTPVTRMRMLIDKVVRLSFGVSYDPINNR
jgi:protein involved in polysaccharide export with SLBB domain